MSETMTAPAPKVRSRPPQDFYQAFAETAPGTLGGKYLRQFWHPIAVSSELPPGRAKPIRLLSENFTLYRGETGTAALSFRWGTLRAMRSGACTMAGNSARTAPAWSAPPSPAATPMCTSEPTA